MSRTRRPIDDESLALERAGLRFRDPATEADFKRWYALEAVPYLRLAVAASAFGWFVGWLALGIALPHGFAEGGGAMETWFLEGRVPAEAEPESRVPSPSHLL